MKRERCALSSSEPAVSIVGIFALHYFFFLFRAGEVGLPLPRPPYTYFCFFSAGFRIWGRKGRLAKIRCLVIGQSATYLERTQQTLVDTHHGACIVEFTTIVGRAKERDKLSLREEFVTVFYNLMRSADKVHVMLLQESGYNVGTKRERYATVVFAPSCNVFVGVRP